MVMESTLVSLKMRLQLLHVYCCLLLTIRILVGGNMCSHKSSESHMMRK